MKVKLYTLPAEDHSGRYVTEVWPAGPDDQQALHTTAADASRSHTWHMAYDWAERLGHQVLGE